MKLKSKLMAAAIALVAASGANAAIDTGTTGNGELFVSLTTATSSYTRDLNLTYSAFESAAAAGTLNFSLAADSLLTSWLGTVSGPIEMNVYGLDGNGTGTNSRHIVSTFNAPSTFSAKQNGTILNAIVGAQSKIGSINAVLTGTINSATFAVGTNGYTGTVSSGASFNDSMYNQIGFKSSSAGMYDMMEMVRVNANSSGTAMSTYTQYFAGTTTTAAQAYFSAADNSFHLTALAVPEPSEYALMLAGLGMLGFMARRRLNNRA